MKTYAAVMVLGAGVLLGVGVGCGTPGAPMPPSLDLPRPVEDLQASRRGDVVTLSWTLPQETTDQTAVKKIGKTRVCRVINQEHMGGCVPVIEVPPPAGAKTGQGGAQEEKQVITARDTVPPEAKAPDGFAVYAVEVQNGRGRSAGLSNQVKVPLAPISQPESLSEARVLADAVVLQAKITLSSLDASQERFRLNRQEKGSGQQVTASEIPRPTVGAPGEAISLELRDESFEWEKAYDYTVTVIATEKLSGGKSAQFESDPTAVVTLTPHDVFAPAKPEGLQAVYSGILQGGGNFIDLTWNANSERDLAGYNVYRREAQVPASAATKMNSNLLITPSFRDQNIQKGTTYIYSVSAVDVRNNESERSGETSEFVPK
ncbi:MAG TPA: fibronectin type III domain-containing protein [Terriglobales bacterium]